MRQSRLMHSNNSGLTQYPRNVLSLLPVVVSWVGCGCGDNGQVQVSLKGHSVPWSILGQHWRQCDCLSVVIIRCQSVTLSVKMSIVTSRRDMTS